MRWWWQTWDVWLIVISTLPESTPTCCPSVIIVIPYHTFCTRHFILTKASALCGALPSTQCCVCCSGALPSCTEVFALGWSRTPLRTPLKLHASFSLACAASSSCPCCLPGRPLRPAAAGLRLLSSPSSLFVLWLSLPASLPVCAWCQLTYVTKDCRGPPVPTSHTHTPATVTSSLLSEFCFSGW